MFALPLLGGAIGAGVGALTNPDDRIGGALVGGGLGALTAGAGRVAGSLLRGTGRGLLGAYTAPGGLGRLVMDGIFAAPSIANMAITGQVSPYDIAGVAAPFFGTALAGKFGRVVTEPSPEIPKLAAQKAHEATLAIPGSSYDQHYQIAMKRLEQNPRYRRDYLQPNDTLGTAIGIGGPTLAGIMPQDRGVSQDFHDDIYAKAYGQ